VAVARDTTTVRVAWKTHERLREIAAQTGEQLSEVLDRAVEREARRQFWEQFHAAVERLRADPEQWAAYRAESAALDGTLMDGLNPDEDWQFLADVDPEDVQFLEPEHAASAQPR
jgi:predicted transcriptional regulator